MSMPRVVHVVAAGEVGGAERMLVDLARGADSHAIALFTPNQALRQLFADAGLRVHDRGPAAEHAIAHLWRAFGPSDAAWLAGVLADERAEIVQTHTFGSQPIAARVARRCGARLVRTEHSTRVYRDPTCWWLSRRSLVAADAVVAISAHVRDVALARAPEIAPRLRMIHNGIDTSAHAPSAPPRPEGPFRFVIVARLDPRKGVDQALHALARVPDAQLIVVGDGEQRARLHALAKSLAIEARVEFAGHQRDPRRFVRRADAALCSSREEGLSLALLEAMAQGLPVVALPVGGVTEYVRDGENGWLARENRVDALAEVMRAAVAAPARELFTRGKNARDEVERRFSRAAMCSAWDELYRELVGRPRIAVLGDIR